MIGSLEIEWRTLDSSSWSPNPGEWSHSGIAVLPDGRIVFAEPGVGNLVFLEESSGERARMETPTLVNHGILFARRNGREGLWLADPGTETSTGQLAWLDLQSQTFEIVERPAPTWRPTSTAVVTDDLHRDDLWVADGYGDHLLYRFSADGRIDVFDGSVTGQRFDCPHGVAIDRRGDDELVVVADRGNRRLVFFEPDGTFVRVVTDDLLTSPSSIAQRRGDLLVTDLYGALLAVDELDNVRSLVGDGRGERRPGWPNALSHGEPVRPALIDGVLNSPHGVAVAASCDVYLTEWVLGGRQTHLHFKRYAASPSASRIV